MKRFAIFMAAAYLFVSTPILEFKVLAAGTQQITESQNNNKPFTTITCKVPTASGVQNMSAILYSGKTYLPLNAFRSLKLEGFKSIDVNYNKPSNGAELVFINFTKNDGEVIPLSFNNTEDKVHWKYSTFNSPYRDFPNGTYIIRKDNRIYVPISILRDDLGIDINWDSKTKTASFTGKSKYVTSTTTTSANTTKQEQPTSVSKTTNNYVFNINGYKLTLSRQEVINTIIGNKQDFLETLDTTLNLDTFLLMMGRSKSSMTAKELEEVNKILKNIKEKTWNYFENLINDKEFFDVMVECLQIYIDEFLKYNPNININNTMDFIKSVTEFTNSPKCADAKAKIQKKFEPFLSNIKMLQQN